MPQGERFHKFAIMTSTLNHIAITRSVRYIVLDTRDSYTCSFPRIVPFCPQLFYFSDFKDFHPFAQAKAL